MRKLLSLLAMIALTVPELSAAPEVSFSKEVLPILAENCFQCHGPDENAREADLRLDVYEDATRARDGYQAISPGNIAKSELINRIVSDDEAVKMPPADFGKHLTKKEVLTLQNWITNGARFEQHWSFRQIAKPALPQNNKKTQRWVRNEVDLFVGRKL